MHVEQHEKEGILIKQGKRLKSWRRRWFVMRDGLLDYYKLKTYGKERKGSIALYSSRVESSNEIPNNHLGFQIVTPHRIYHLYGESDQETKFWIDAIRMHKRDTELRINSIFFG